MSAKIPLAGVIGAPVGHSKSPALHNHWLRSLGIAGHYVPLHVEPGDLEDALRMMPRMGFVGTNVTIPHKEAVLDLATEVSEVAARIGAANTLQFLPDGEIFADNTDASGYSDSLVAGAPDWQADQAPAHVFGAGGAARAVLVALMDLGVPKITLSNRTRARAEAMAASLGDQIEVVDWRDEAEALSEAGLVVNTTSLGMSGQPPFDLDLSQMQPGCVASDIVYVPLETPFLSAARAQQAHIVDGVGMLIHQATPGFERWFGAKPVVDDTCRDLVLA
ncbi:MAG: shikimate dehydrogenase [Mangrovicoccus sp.]